jgi:serine/threonine protein kinase
MTDLLSHTHFFLAFFRILFRDLKPENVARNQHHAMQLFDFGLAKELKAGDLVIAGHGHGHDQYRLTGLTGTLRIMAPEVIQCQPYGLPADVYSFGILLWEVFEGTKNQLTAMEISQQNQRPELPSNNGSMRMPLDTLIQQCWAADINDRPTFDTICQELQSKLLAMDKETIDRLPTSSVIHRSEYLQQLSLESSESDMEQ